MRVRRQFTMTDELHRHQAKRHLFKQSGSETYTSWCSSRREYDQTDDAITTISFAALSTFVVEGAVCQSCLYNAGLIPEHGVIPDEMQELADPPSER